LHDTNGEFMRAPSLAPDDALRRIRDLRSEHDRSEGGLR
jgi:hypothetical protein